MLCLVVLLEAVVCGEDILWNDEVDGGRAEWPEVRTENHDTEIEVAVFRMGHLHLFLKLTSEILTKTHVYDASQS